MKESIRYFVLLLAVSLTEACTPVPQRPHPSSDVERTAIEQCDRDYSICLNGGKIDSPGFNTDNDTTKIYDTVYLPQGDCNKNLKRCYNDSLKTSK